LVGGVVRVAERHGRLALFGNGELLEVEVEVLRAGLNGLVEAGAHPDDVLVGEAHLFGHAVRDCGLETFLALRLVADDPRLVRRVAGGDGELALGEGLAGGAVVAGAARGFFDRFFGRFFGDGVFGRAVVAAACGEAEHGHCAESDETSAGAALFHGSPC